MGGVRVLPELPGDQEPHLLGDVHGLIADALERAAAADRAKLTAALAGSTWSGHLMPYGPTKFVNGQNEGAAPCNTQVQGNDIKVILPREFANGKAIFPMKA